MIKFRGHAHRSLDDKGRLILPPHFKDEIFAHVPEGKIILTMLDNHIICLTPQQWQDAEDKLYELDASPTIVQKLIKRLYSGYSEVQVSKQGRIIIPAQHRKSGRLQQDVTVLGVRERFEIWPTDEYEELLAEPVGAGEELDAYRAVLPL